MHHKLLPVLLGSVIWFAWSCGGESTDFKRYYRSLRILQAPVEFSLARPLHTETAEVDSVLRNRFAPPDGLIVGRLFPEESYVSILYVLPTDVGTPVLQTYSQRGEPIDTLVLAGQWVADVGTETSYATTIDSAGIITITDTLSSVQVDTRGNPISGTDTTRVAVKHYLLRPDGHIIDAKDLKFIL